MVANQASIRVLVIDDHPIVRQGLRMLIGTDPRYEVVAEVGSRLDALTAAAQQQPDLIILDLLLKNESGLELLPELLIAARQARILIFTARDEIEEHYRAVRLGAMGVVMKFQESEVLMRAIESVQAGEVWLEHTMTVRILSEMLRSGETSKADPESDKIAKLTAREREVVTLVGAGLKNRQIAERLYISEVTVRHHLTSVFSKLEVKDRLELALYAYQYGLAKPPFYGSGAPLPNAERKYVAANK